MSQPPDPWKTRIDTKREFLQGNLRVDARLLNTLMGKSVKDGEQLLTEVEKKEIDSSGPLNSQKFDCLLETLRYKGPKKESFSLLCESLLNIGRNWIVAELNGDTVTDRSFRRTLLSQPIREAPDPYTDYGLADTETRKSRSEGYGQKRLYRGLGFSGVQPTSRRPGSGSDGHYEKHDGTGTGSQNSIDSVPTATLEDGGNVSALRQQNAEKDREIELLRTKVEEKTKSFADTTCSIVANFEDAKKIFENENKVLQDGMKVVKDENNVLRHEIDRLRHEVKEYEKKDQKLSSAYLELTSELQEKIHEIEELKSQQYQQHTSDFKDAQEEPTSESH